jgi:alanyl-tRNA synthetase
MQDRLVHDAAAVLKTSPLELLNRLESLLDERKKLERELAEAKKALALGGGTAAGDSDIQTINGIKFMKRILGDMDSKDMKGLVDESKAKLGSGVVALVSTNGEGRASLYVGVTADLTPKLSAVDLVRAGATMLGGKGGGGRPDLAQAGGPDAGKAAEALEAISALIAG